MKVGAEALEVAEMTGEAAGQEAVLDNKESIVAADRKAAVTVNEDLMPDQEKCTKLPAAIAARNVKCHLSQQLGSQSIVVNAFQNIRRFEHNM